MGTKGKIRPHIIAADSYFSRIGEGHEHAIQRPSLHTDFGQDVDRALRDMVKFANENGDCIINVGHGYYRPIPGDLVDEMELKEYFAKDNSRADSIKLKIACMSEAFENKRKETVYANQQQRERQERRKGSSEAS